MTRASGRPRLLRLLGILAGCLLFLGVLPAQLAGAATRTPAGVQVDGQVGVPAAYSLADLAALPQVSLPTQLLGRSGTHTLTGVSLQSLIAVSQPQLPTAKNAVLRETATVYGRYHQAVSTTVGELDPGFGNHPALLVLAVDGQPVPQAPALAFPGDEDLRRTVVGVERISVAVAPTTPASVDPGAVSVVSGERTVVLSAARLAALPQQTRTVSFLAGNAPQTHVETGPTLGAVLRAARVRSGSATTVAATAVDGYVATVTPGEASSGGRTLLLALTEDGVALAQPRLVPEGDVKGGRYVTGVTTLVVTGDGWCRHR